MKTAIFGGDKRMLFAAKAFVEAGHEVCIAGFDDMISLCEIQICTPSEAAHLCDIAVLPVRPLSGGFLNTPFSREKLPIAELMRMIGKKPVYTGCADQLRSYALGEVYDYAAREDFVWQNAQLTAEGAVGLLVSGYEGSVYGSKILITGFGRIGKCLSKLLTAMGAHVAVAARKPADLAMIAQFGMEPVDYTALDCSVYQVIFNTVPAMIFDQEKIGDMRDDVYLIDLSSKPGGVDFQAAESRDLTCVHALSLPGKTAPLAAGTIIKDTVVKMMGA